MRRSQPGQSAAARGEGDVVLVVVIGSLPFAERCGSSGGWPAGEVAAAVAVARRRTTPRFAIAPVAGRHMGATRPAFEEAESPARDCRGPRPCGSLAPQARLPAPPLWLSPPPSITSLTHWSARPKKRLRRVASAAALAFAALLLPKDCVRLARMLLFRGGSSCSQRRALPCTMTMLFSAE